MKKLQQRAFHAELRAAADGKSIIGRIPYNSEADLGYFKEKLSPGCFRESLQDGHKIHAFLSHDTAKPLGNTRSKTLVLRDTADALEIEIRPDQGTTWGRDALLAAKNADWSGFSFGFSILPSGEIWNGETRTITRAELWEVSPVSFPAYEDSEISVRNLSNNHRSNTMNKKYNSRGELLMSQYDWENNHRSVNSPPDQDDFHSVEVEDQPIYRGKWALGQQLIDIAAMNRPGGHDQDARSRFDQMVKREQILQERRAAGTGGMVAAVGQDGGLLLQGETAMVLIQNGFNNSAVLSRAAQRDLGILQFAEVIGLDETSRADGSRGGGVRVYTDKELALINQSKTKFDMIRLEPKRLTGLYYASNEILQSAPALTAEMESLFNEEFAFRGQDMAINGSGAGEALGIMKAPALVTIAKEVGQAAGTLVFENLVKMKARHRARNRNSLLWIANQDVEPALYTLVLPIGTGGSVIPAYVPSSDPTSEVAGVLLGTPIVFVEQCATLGTVGDILLCDWSQYFAVSRGGVESAASTHLKFDYNQTAFRFVTWFDGQPRMKAAMTPYKGSNTVSPFVALATR